MREIKFRAWSPETERMVDLQEITPLALSDSMNSELALQGMSGLFIPFNDKWPLMQYTGLKDCNDREIYEGDIVSWEEYQGYEDGRTFQGRYLVKWNAEDLRFDFQDIYTDEWWPLADTKFEEVIGNIYENHELLEVK